MYKCADCGNTEKFIGYAQENGNVLIYKNDFEDCAEPYTWIYNISEKNWSSNLKFIKCSVCKSENIIKI
ncbi:MAG: hypothetical protein ACYC0D_08120 [Candidatus Humimicrobiaceae bacterium]